MKLKLYNYSLPIVFSYCEEVLKEMSYDVHHIDYKNGLISASRPEGILSHSSLLDLKFSREKFAVGIIIISSSMSAIFGSIYENPEGEKEFIESLFEKLEAREIGTPFVSAGDDPLEAMAS